MKLLLHSVRWLSAALLAVPVIASAAPERIVVVDGALTEIVYALGQEDKLVGVDTTSVYPAAATQLPQVGYKRALSAEGTLSLAPDLVIASEDAGPEGILGQIESAGVTVASVTAKASVDAVGEKVKRVAALLEQPDAGEALWQSIQADIETVQASQLRLSKPVKVLFILNASGGRNLVVGGANTHADAIIKLAGAENAVQGIEGYKPVTTEALVAMAPDVVLMMKRNEHSMPAAELFAIPGLDRVPAADNQRLVTMDGMLLLGFGPRIGQAMKQLHEALYPAVVAAQ